MPPTIRERIITERGALLSSLWIFVLLNMLFRDIHEFARPGAIEEFMAQDVSETLLLAAGIVLSLIISMIVIARILPPRINRWVNLIVAIVVIGSMLSNPPGDLDDVWFMAVEVLGLLAIIGVAWTGRQDDSSELAQEQIPAGAG